jgi:hypothetical protein
LKHPTDEEIRELTLGKLTTAQSIRVQRHIYHCSDCLRRLIEADLPLVIADAVMPPHSIKPDVSRPVFTRHDTADGFIYSRVERKGRRWIERHWGDELSGGGEYRTMREANDHAVAAFWQLFPEHRCTERCSADPQG